MSDRDEVRFACIGCGALNPTGVEVCSGCGHRFRDPVPLAAPPALTTNPYAAPKARVDPRPGFRIGSAMLLIAVIALCLAAFAAGEAQGVLATIGLLTATIRTFIVAGRREAEGRPMSSGQKVLTFVGTLGSLVLVAASSIIAFGMTCFPIGLAGGDLSFAVFVGLLAALVAAVGLTYVLIRASRSRARRERDREQIRWR